MNHLKAINTKAARVERATESDVRQKPNGGLGREFRIRASWLPSAGPPCALLPGSLEVAAQNLGGAAVRLADPCGIDAQCRGTPPA